MLFNLFSVDVTLDSITLVASELIFNLFVKLISTLLILLTIDSSSLFALITSSLILLSKSKSFVFNSDTTYVNSLDINSWNLAFFSDSESITVLKFASSNLALFVSSSIIVFTLDKELTKLVILELTVDILLSNEAAISFSLASALNLSVSIAAILSAISTLILAFNSLSRVSREVFSLFNASCNCKLDSTIALISLPSLTLSSSFDFCKLSSAAFALFTSSSNDFSISLSFALSSSSTAFKLSATESKASLVLPTKPLTSFSNFANLSFKIEPIRFLSDISSSKSLPNFSSSVEERSTSALIAAVLLSIFFVCIPSTSTLSSNKSLS